MKYTENFHLPQWDETDRIMRTDFNSAMANLEEGLSGGKSSEEELRAKSWRRICRLAYNQYCAVQSMNPAPGQAGIFRRTPGESNVSGTRVINGIHSAGISSVTLTEEMFEANFQQLTELSVVKGKLAACVPLTGAFNMPAAGRLERFILQGNYSNNVEGTAAMFRVTLTNRDTGSVEYSADVNLVQDHTSAYLINYFVKTPVAFLGHVNYLLMLQPLEAVYDMKASIVFSENTRVNTYSTEGTVSASCTIHEPDGGLGGMVILRCTSSGAGGELTFRWDGVERKPVTTRVVPVGGGLRFYEYVYLREDAVAANSTLSLRFACAPGGSFQFYDWGAVLF